jgi:hypothetical protein
LYGLYSKFQSQRASLQALHNVTLSPLKVQGKTLLIIKEESGRRNTEKWIPPSKDGEECKM